MLVVVAFGTDVFAGRFFRQIALTGDMFVANTRIMKNSIALIVVGTRMGRMV